MVAKGHKITIVPLFKKICDIMVFCVTIIPLVTRKAFSDRFRSNFQGIFKADHQEFHFFKFFLNLIFLMLLNFIKFLVNLMMYF